MNYCWKCGQKLPQNSNICTSCGENQSERCPLPQNCGDEAKALRAIYDHYGRNQVLSDATTLFNAIGDYLGEDGKKLRFQVRIAMDAGLGKLYLSQLDSPAEGFDNRCIALLTGIGLTEAVARNLKNLFDAMVGFQVAAPQPQFQPDQAQPSPPEIESAQKEVPLPRQEAAPASNPTKKTFQNWNWFLLGLCIVCVFFMLAALLTHTL